MHHYRLIAIRTATKLLLIIITQGGFILKSYTAVQFAGRVNSQCQKNSIFIAKTFRKKRLAIIT